MIPVGDVASMGRDEEVSMDGTGCFSASTSPSKGSGLPQGGRVSFDFGVSES